MKTILTVATLGSSLLAQTLTIEPIMIEDTLSNISTSSFKDAEAKDTNRITLEDKLQAQNTLSSVVNEKGESAISFRGLDYKTTQYTENGIPLYRTTNGDVDGKFFITNADLEFNDGSGASSTGVSSMGGEAALHSKAPSQEFESTLDVSISTNDQFYHASAGTLMKNIYLQVDANLYKTSGYSLSDDFKKTALQNTDKYLNSDKEQKSISLKSGVYFNDALHLAAKVSLTKSDYGITPNVHTDLASPVWNAYTRIDKKDLKSFYLYGDYVKKDIEYSFRAYYDEYSDIYAIYNNESYTDNQPLVYYDDKRLGSIFKAVISKEKYKNSFIFQVDENKHLRTGGEMDAAKFILDNFKLSFLNQWYLTNQWQIESALSYSLLKAKKSMASVEDKKSLDALVKLSYTDDAHSVYASVAKKSRMPAMSEMFAFFPWEVANSDLKEEESMQYSLGYQRYLPKATSLDLSLYYYDIKDLIIYRDNGYINRNTAKHYGIEVGMSNNYFKKHHLYFAYAYTHATDSNDENLALIPKNKIRIEDQFKITHNLQAHASYQYVGSRYSSNSATYTDEQKKLSSYNLINTHLKYKISKNTNSRIGIKNLLDEDYEFLYGNPSAGRSFYISLEMNI